MKVLSISINVVLTKVGFSFSRKQLNDSREPVLIVLLFGWFLGTVHFLYKEKETQYSLNLSNLLQNLAVQHAYNVIPWSSAEYIYLIICHLLPH